MIKQSEFIVLKTACSNNYSISNFLCAWLIIASQCLNIVSTLRSHIGKLAV